MGEALTMAFQVKARWKDRRYTILLFILLIIFVGTPISSPKAQKKEATEAQNYAFVNVNVVPMDKERVINSSNQRDK